MARLGMVIDDGNPFESDSWHHRFFREKAQKKALEFQRKLARRIAIRLQIQALERELDRI